MVTRKLRARDLLVVNNHGKARLPRLRVLDLGSMIFLVLRFLAFPCSMIVLLFGSEAMRIGSDHGLVVSLDTEIAEVGPAGAHEASPDRAVRFDPVMSLAVDRVGNLEVDRVVSLEGDREVSLEGDRVVKMIALENLVGRDVAILTVSVDGDLHLHGGYLSVIDGFQNTLYIFVFERYNSCNHYISHNYTDHIVGNLLDIHFH